MASTNFSYGTIIASTWLNEVNNAVFNIVPTLAPLVNPTFTTPNLGVASATSINKVVITTPTTGATLTIPDGQTATVSGTNTGDQLTFKNIAVSGQSNVVANILTDTLTFAGTGMTITTDPVLKKITFAAGSSNIQRSARTANTMLVKADQGSFIDITSGTFTQTFDTAANLGSGWNVYLRNSGTGDITIPSSDGVTNWIMYPGEARFFQTDGTNFYSIVLQPFYKVATASGNFIKPPGYSRFEGEMWGGGAGGGTSDSSTTTSGAGGGGGGYVPFLFPATSLATTEAFTVGAGGTGSTLTGTSGGNAGGNSTFKGITAYGATGSTGGYAFFNNVTSGQLYWGNNSDASLFAGGVSSNSTSSGGRTVYGGGAGVGFNTSGTKLTPGSTFYGGLGGQSASAVGTAPGGGGACGTANAVGGNGARGEFRIWGVV